MKKNSVDVSGLSEYLLDYSRKVCKQAATDIRDDLTEETFYALVCFYEDYSPRYYKRHYYNFLEKSFRKYYSNAHGNIYRGGVEFTPQLMDNIYQSSRGFSDAQVTQQVFDTVYAGFHGVASTQIYPFESPRAIPHVMSPSPMQIIEERRDYIEKHIDKYISKAQSKIKS